MRRYDNDYFDDDYDDDDDAEAERYSKRAAGLRRKARRSRRASREIAATGRGVKACDLDAVARSLTWRASCLEAFASGDSEA